MAETEKTRLGEQEGDDGTQVRQESPGRGCKNRRLEGKLKEGEVRILHKDFFLSYIFS